MEVQRLGEGTVRLGSRFKLHRRLAGRIHEGIWEITEFERPRQAALAAHTDRGLIDHRSRARFEPTDAGTRLVLQVQPTPRGWARLLTPFIRRAMRRELSQDLEELRAVLEKRL